MTPARGRDQSSPGRNESWPPATGRRQHSDEGWSGPGPGSAGVPLTIWWLVLLALQLVKLVHVLLLSGWRPHSPFSEHTLDATAGNTFEGHEVKVDLSGAAQPGPGASLANFSWAEKLKHLRYK